MYDNSRQYREIQRYIGRMRETGMTQRYICQMHSILRSFRAHCKEREIHSTSGVSGQVVLDFLRRYETMSLSHQRTTASILRMYLAHHRNPAMIDLRLRYSGSSRTRVDWLTPEETQEIFDTLMQPPQAVLIGGGLLMGLRRIETLRMTNRDAQEALRAQVLRVRGKGGKERPVPLHEAYAPILEAFLRWKGPGNPEAPMLGFRRTRSEDLLKEFCTRFGRKFTFHTMRRTFGRNLWLLGVPIETISEILGHSSSDMTRRYLGLNLTDMRQALSCYKIARICTISERPA